MPIGLISDEDFIKEYSKSHPLSDSPEPSKDEVLEGVVITPPDLGRGHSVEVPESLRKIIGETSAIDGRKSAMELAEEFGVSPSSVSAYSNGAKSTASYDSPNKRLSNHINQAKERIAKKAKSRLIAALNEITPAKLADATLRDASAVAKDMAGIIKDMEPKHSMDHESMNAPQFVLYSPRFHKEESYQVITVKE